MILYAEQIQYPVGQGGLHLTQIALGRRSDRERLSIVYDCGGQGNRKALDQNIEFLRRRLDRTKDGRYIIDLLVLSHLHLDHINGFERLTDGGVVVSRLIIPYYDETNRDLLVAQAASAGASDTDLARIMSAIADPAGWAGDRVLQIVTLAPGGDPPAPDGAISPEPIPFEPREDLDPSFGGGGRDNTGLVLMSGGRPLGSLSISSARGVVGRVGSIAGPQLNPTDWLIAPYCLKHVPPTASGHRDYERFQSEMIRLRKKYQASGANGNPFSKSRAFRAGMIEAFRHFAGPANRWNPLSVSMFNGLVRKSDFEVYADTVHAEFMIVERNSTAEFSWEIGIWNMWNIIRYSIPIQNNNESHAWIMTGDADLINNFDDWTRYYSGILKYASFLQLPHHGSSNNSDDKLALASRPLAFATRRSNDKKHPSPLLLGALRRKHIDTHSVDETADSVLRTVVVASL